MEPSENQIISSFYPFLKRIFQATIQIFLISDQCQPQIGRYAIMGRIVCLTRIFYTTLDVAQTDNIDVNNVFLLWDAICRLESSRVRTRTNSSCCNNFDFSHLVFSNE